MNNKNNSTNFWISYADLMAGLLFVFILLIGAIIVKYSLLQSESKILEQTLEKEKLALEKNRDELKKKEAKIKNALTELKDTKKDLLEVKNKFDKTKEKLKQRLLENEKLKLLQEQKQEQINSLTSLQKQLDEKLKTLAIQRNDLEANLKLLEEKNSSKDKKIDSLLEELLLKEKLAKSMLEQTKSLDDEIKLLELRLKDTTKKHDILVQDLSKTKEKIKSFTGIKVKVISLLKEKLGNKIQIDPKNGSLRLSSNILFDEGKFELKANSKESLKKAIYDYFYAILENEEINKHIDKVIIEGHTNSKGNFLYNLDLSQKRAYSVMDFLLSLDFENKKMLRNLIVASGRSYLDPVYNKNGKEDQEASRRIEIKFSLKNEDAIKEIANLLN